MTHSELIEICNKIIELHITDLEKELPKIIDTRPPDASREEFIAHLVAQVSALSIKHSIQATTDVLMNLGLIEFDD